MKVIKFETACGEVWVLPLDVVAQDRAKYYSERDPTITYDDEYKCVMEDNYIGVDWFTNEMSFNDIKGSLIKVKSAPPPDLANKIYGSELSIDEYPTWDGA